MKALDGWIAAAGLVALGLAGALVYKSYRQNTGTSMQLPSAQAPAPSVDAFPSCKDIPPGMRRVRCEVAVARREGRIRCAGGRLYHVTRDASGQEHFNPWPASIRCWNDEQAQPSG